ncbi:MAG: hypothetical protein QOI94_2740, partial [Acidobacteriaceae bacterium]|nr:hypothetical protein [Acidobacteriaceae bacterium]
MKNASVQQPLGMKPVPFPLSSRAGPTCPGLPWRDLRFYGPFLEMQLRDLR